MDFQETKYQTLDWMRQQWSQCRACALCEERTNVVFGYGNPDASILVVGEAPGSNEDKAGIPFVGQAGGLLDQYLATTSIDPEVIKMVESKKHDPAELRELLLKDIYFTNVVGCRPPDNRDPLGKEIEACRGRLEAIIYLVDPVIILAVGRFAVEALLGKKVGITSVRGELFDVTIQGRMGPVTYPLMAMLHTAYLLRQNDFNVKGGMSDKTYEDVLEAMRILDLFNMHHHGIPRPPNRPKPVRRGSA